MPMKPILVHVPEDLLASIDKRAKADGVSRAAWIRRRLTAPAGETAEGEMIRAGILTIRNGGRAPLHVARAPVGRREVTPLPKRPDKR